MAAGDVKQGITSVASGQSLDIKPTTAGEEWVIHNIFYDQAVEYYITDGTKNLKFDTDGSAGGRLGMTFHVSNTQWIRMKNTATSANTIAYDGIQTK